MYDDAENNSNEPKPDLSEIFDLNRHKAVRDYTEGFEALFRERDAVNDKVRDLANQASQDLFSPDDINAMKAIARWRKDGKGNDAAGKLAALRRVSNAVQYDLFSWSDRHRST